MSMGEEEKGSKGTDTNQFVSAKRHRDVREGGVGHVTFRFLILSSVFEEKHVFRK